MPQENNNNIYIQYNRRTNRIPILQPLATVYVGIE